MTLGLGSDAEPTLCSPLGTLLPEGRSYGLLQSCTILQLTLILPSQFIKAHKIRAVVGVSYMQFHRLD